MKNYTLTGKFYHKKTWFGLVLMVEIKYSKPFNNGGYITMEDVIEDIKATEKDLAYLNLIKR